MRKPIIAPVFLCLGLFAFVFSPSVLSEGADPRNREMLFTFTGAGGTKGQEIKLYIDGVDYEEVTGDGLITIGGEWTYRMEVLLTEENAVRALDIVSVHRGSTEQVPRRRVDRLPISDLQKEEGVRFRADVSGLLDLLVSDPVVFRIRARTLRNEPNLTLRIHYLKNYDRDLRKTLTLHAINEKDGWQLIRHRPIDHEIKPNLHVIHRTHVNGVLIRTEPVDSSVSSDSGTNSGSD